MLSRVLSPLLFFRFRRWENVACRWREYFFSVLPSRVYLQEVQLQREKKQASFEGLASNGTYISVSFY